MSTDMDTAAVEAHIRTVAETQIRPLFRSLGDGDVSTKTGPNDLVTVADVAAEKALTPLLREIADAPVLGEEATSADAGVATVAAAAEACWTVDPIDGTFNFVHGSPKYGVMVGYAEGGAAQRGWIYHPESGDMFAAARGEGATVNGQPVRGEAPESLAGLRAIVAPRQIDTSALAAAVDTVLEPNMSAAWDYTDVVLGDADVLVYNRSFAWDHIPGTVMVRELGFKVAHLDGSDYAVADGNAGPIIVAPVALWDEVRDVLAPAIEASLA